LKQTRWLIDINNDFVLPEEISLSELSDSYIKNDENVEILVDILGFQIDEIKIIEKKTGKKVILLDPDKDKDILKAIEEKEKKGRYEEIKNDSWTPKVEPEDVETFAEEIEPELLDIPDLRGQRPSENNIKKSDAESKIDNQCKNVKGKLKKELKDIGKWGEKFVYNYLKKQFQNEDDTEIIWLNEKEEAGKGYDFSIVSHGKDIEYIEVKTKIDSEPQLFEITGTQWEFARKLYNENEGDKYKIYVVSNAGTKNAKIKIIKNPAKLWKDGKLYAHPIHFRL
jgi:hypothetical protein